MKTTVCLCIALFVSGAALRAEDPSIPVARAAKAGSLEKQVIGIWKVVSFERREDAAGDWTFPMGNNPKGRFIYLENGEVAVQIMRFPPPPELASGHDLPLTAEQLRAAHDGYIALFGTYTVDEAKRTVVQHIEGAFPPFLVGMNMVRPLQLAGDRLIIGDQTTLRIVTERLK